MSPKHPKAVMIVVLITLWESIHATHFLGFLWGETPGWVKTLLIETTHFTPSLLSLILGVILGIELMNLGPSLLRWLIARLWPDLAAKPKKRRRSSIEKSDKSGKAPQKSRQQRIAKSSQTTSKADRDSEVTK